MGIEFRLSPAMVSRKLQVLAFAKSYFVAWGRGPSYGEIAGAFDISRSHAKGLVRLLIADGTIAREAGSRRGITFPDLVGRVTVADALLVLRSEGWRVDRDILSADPGQCTNETLPGRPEIEHIPDIEIGDIDGYQPS